MRPHNDWWAGTAVTLVWGATVWLTYQCIGWNEPLPWFAWVIQLAFAVVITSIILVIARGFALAYTVVSREGE